MRRFLFLISVSFILSFQSWAQEEHYATWNKNYPKQDVTKVLTAEQEYANKVDSGKVKKGSPSYSRMDKMRFKAVFTGETRPMQEKARETMKFVFGFFGQKKFLYVFDEIKKEYEFKVGGQKLWLSIQNRIDPYFVKEVKKNEEVLLYCLFFNAHPQKNDLRNYFLISEFRAKGY